MKKILIEFEKFALKGNMIDLAVGVIIGGAFNSIVTSLVKDIVMPVLSLITGKIDFTNMFIALNGEKYTTLAAAQEAGAATLNYGSFITEVIHFVIMAFVVFMIVRMLNKLKKKPENKPQIEKICPYCKSKIDIHATRCPHCTSQLEE